MTFWIVRLFARFGGLVALLTLILSGLLIIAICSYWMDPSELDAATWKALKLSGKGLDPFRFLVVPTMFLSAIGLFAGGHFFLYLCQAIVRRRSTIMAPSAPVRWFSLTTLWMILPLAGSGVMIGWVASGLYEKPGVLQHLAGLLLLAAIAFGFVVTHRQLSRPRHRAIPSRRV